MADNPLNESSARPASGLRWGRIGRYQILAHLATGGMGAVYRALDVKRGREVALKVLNPEQAAAKPVLRERFNLEARYGRRLNHQNVVSLYDFGEAHGVRFLALEFVPGVDLGEYVRRKGKLTVDESRQVMIQATKAIGHLYRHGIIHRDIKPANFLIREENGRPFVKLIDFGLARRTTELDAPIREGSTLGTVDYISPEQARSSDAADIRSDIYSLGCTWFHLLTGRPLFNEGTPLERLARHISEAPPDVRKWCPDISPETLKILERMLAKDPAERYQTPAALLDDLEERHREIDWEIPVEDELPVSPDSLVDLAKIEETPRAPVQSTPPRRQRGGPRRYRENEEEDPRDAEARVAQGRRQVIKFWLGAAGIVLLLALLVAFAVSQSRP